MEAGVSFMTSEVSTYQFKTDDRPIQFNIETLNVHCCFSREGFAVPVKQGIVVNESQI